ncbi:MAG: outer membrane protein assembly factor BamD [Desulfobacterales bacterium]|nr:outer membrane protein assembly factor BamD [Desulfobacterales bacterium]
MKKSVLKLLLCLLIPVFFSGCSWFGREEQKSAEELAGHGMENFEDGDYRNALESFEQLRDWYPFSKYAILAELKIADSHYHLKEYEEAIGAYQSFENLHPRNEAIPYVIYQIGRCYFDRIDTIDRDQASTKQALDIFKRLQKQYPDDQYSVKAEEHIVDCFKSLAGNEFYIGEWYFKTGHYKSSVQRFYNVINEYPDVGLNDKALEFIELCDAAIYEELEEKWEFKIDGK